VPVPDRAPAAPEWIKIVALVTVRDTVPHENGCVRPASPDLDRDRPDRLFSGHLTERWSLPIDRLNIFVQLGPIQSPVRGAVRLTLPMTALRSPGATRRGFVDVASRLAQVRNATK
jgi:hypothetical protein